MTVISFKQFLDYNAFSSTGSLVYAPSITPIEGSGNQYVIPSGSVQAIINVADSYIVPLISKDTALQGYLDWDTSLSSTDVINLAQSFALDYTCFIFWVIMHGGAISGGWDYKLSELDVKRGGVILGSIKGLIEGYKFAALSKLQILQPLSISVGYDMVEDRVSNTSPSFY